MQVPMSSGQGPSLSGSNPSALAMNPASGLARAQSSSANLNMSGMARSSSHTSLGSATQGGVSTSTGSTAAPPGAAPGNLHPNPVTAATYPCVDFQGYPITVAPTLEAGDLKTISEAVSAFIHQVLSYGRHWHVILSALRLDLSSPLLNLLAMDYFIAAEDIESAISCFKRAEANLDMYLPHKHPLSSSSRPALTDRELRYLSAYKAWLNLDFAGAFRAFARITRAYPCDLFAAKRAQLMAFLVGDHAGMLHVLVAGDVAKHCAERPFYHGMLAFALEQNHMLYGALRAALRGIALCPQDPWAIHGAAHALFFLGWTDPCARVLLSGARAWDRCMSFMFTHDWFHTAIACLDEGDVASVCRIFDTAVWRCEGPAGTAETHSLPTARAAAPLPWTFHTSECAKHAGVPLPEVLSAALSAHTAMPQWNVEHTLALLVRDGEVSAADGDASPTSPTAAAPKRRRVKHDDADIDAPAMLPRAPAFTPADVARERHPLEARLRDPLPGDECTYCRAQAALEAEKAAAAGAGLAAAQRVLAELPLDALPPRAATAAPCSSLPATLRGFIPPFSIQLKSYGQDLAGAIGLLWKLELRVLCAYLCGLSAPTHPRAGSSAPTVAMPLLIDPATQAFVLRAGAGADCPAAGLTPVMALTHALAAGRRVFRTQVPELNFRWRSILPYLSRAVPADPFLALLQLVALTRCGELAAAEEQLRQLTECACDLASGGESAARGRELLQSAVVAGEAIVHAARGEYGKAAAGMERVVCGRIEQPATSPRGKRDKKSRKQAKKSGERSPSAPATTAVDIATTTDTDTDTDTDTASDGEAVGKRAHAAAVDESKDSSAEPPLMSAADNTCAGESRQLRNMPSGCMFAGSAQTCSTLGVHGDLDEHVAALQARVDALVAQHGTAHPVKDKAKKRPAALSVFLHDPLDAAQRSGYAPSCLALVGGSNEQRDVFDEWLVCCWLWAGEWERARAAVLRRLAARDTVPQRVLLAGVDMIIEAGKHVPVTSKI